MLFWLLASLRTLLWDILEQIDLKEIISAIKPFVALFIMMD